jgi:hypothetical protein
MSLDNRVRAAIMWYKILIGSAGVIGTVVWFVFLVGSPVVVTLGGVPVLGSIGFTMILLGNGYGLWCLAKSGLDERTHVNSKYSEAYTAYRKRWGIDDDE